MDWTNSLSLWLGLHGLEPVLFSVLARTVDSGSADLDCSSDLYSGPNFDGNVELVGIGSNVSWRRTWNDS